MKVEGSVYKLHISIFWLSCTYLLENQTASRPVLWNSNFSKNVEKKGVSISCSSKLTLLEIRCGLPEVRSMVILREPRLLWNLKICTESSPKNMLKQTYGGWKPLGLAWRLRHVEPQGAKVRFDSRIQFLTELAPEIKPELDSEPCVGKWRSWYGLQFEERYRIDWVGV